MTGTSGMDESGRVPGWDGHTATVEFEAGYGATVKLHCPPTGCTSGSVCGGCGRDLDSPDDENIPCYDCPKPGEVRGCWVRSWVDNLTADEMLSGRLVLPVVARWEDDAMTLDIATVEADA